MRPFVLLVLCAGCAGQYDGIGFADFYGAPLGYEVDGTPLEVAVVAHEAAETADENLANLLELLLSIDAEAPDTRLVVLGELSLGYYYDPADPEAYQWEVAQVVPGEATEAFGQVARQIDAWVVAGLAETDGENLYNSQVLLNPDGELVAVHRKQNLNDWDVESGFTPGTEETLVEIDGIRAAMIICSDVESREIVSSLAQASPSLLLHSWASTAAFGSPVDPSARMIGAWNLTANRYGEELGAPYLGTAYISNPAGTHVAHWDGGQGWAHATIEVTP